MWKGGVSRKPSQLPGLMKQGGGLMYTRSYGYRTEFGSWDILRNGSSQVQSVVFATPVTPLATVGVCLLAPTRGTRSVENLSAKHFKIVFSTTVGGADFQ